MFQKLRIVLLLLLTLILAAPGVPGARDAKAKGSVEDISIAEAQKAIKNKDKNLVVVDVRTPAEFHEGHLAGAKNINLFGTRFEEQIAALPRDKTILVYCRTGKRSAGASDIFRDEGFKVLHMKDGTEGWEKAKLPLVKD